LWCSPSSEARSRIVALSSPMARSLSYGALQAIGSL
jgi:hypothetical protein